MSFLRTPLHQIPQLQKVVERHPNYATATIGAIIKNSPQIADRLINRALHPEQKQIIEKAKQDPVKIKRIQDIISSISETGIRLVQIGAHDGHFDDPLSQHIKENNWNALLVEPQVDAFKKLQQQYVGVENVTPRNVAIAETVGTLTLHKALLPGNLANQGTAIASTNKTQVRREVMRTTGFVRGGLAKIITEQVPAVPLPILLEQEGRTAGSIDFFACDTEGYDAKIMYQLFNDVGARPPIIQYEHLHLDPATADTLARVARIDHGYELISTHKDTFGYLPSAL